MRNLVRLGYLVVLAFAGFGALSVYWVLDEYTDRGL